MYERYLDKISFYLCLKSIQCLLTGCETMQLLLLTKSFVNLEGRIHDVDELSTVLELATASICLKTLGKNKFLDLFKVSVKCFKFKIGNSNVK